MSQRLPLQAEVIRNRGKNTRTLPLMLAMLREAPEGAELHAWVTFGAIGMGVRYVKRGGLWVYEETQSAQTCAHVMEQVLKAGKARDVRLVLSGARR